MAKKPEKKAETKKETKPSVEERLEKIEEFLIHNSGYSRD